MAIVKMKKLRVIAMADSREALLQKLLRLGCVEISEPGEKLADPEWSALLKRGTSRLIETKSALTAVHIALDALKRYAPVKEGLFIRRDEVSQDVFLDAGTTKAAEETTQRIGNWLKELNHLENEESRLLAKQAGLQPWASLDLPLDEVGSAYTVYRLGVCPGNSDTGALRTALDATGAGVELYEIHVDKQQTYYFLVFLKEDESAIQEVLRSWNFSAVVFQDVTGNAAENIQMLDAQLAENRQAQEQIIAAIRACGDQRDCLRLYADQLTALSAKESNSERLLVNDTILFFEGWAPVENIQEIEKLLDGMGCAWEASDPTEEEYPEVPVQLKNNWLTKPLNMVTEMYSLPAYNNVDPNPLMAPFFILFYGIMMADMGYGLLMMAAGLFISKRYRPKGTMGHMFGLMTLCGVSTFIMGAITGGFFGDFLTQVVLLTTGNEFALPALFTPLNDTLMILIGSVALGLVQIVTGMAISFVRKLKQGAILDAIFEEITWWLVFAGIGCMVLGVTNLVLYAGLALVVLGPVITGKGMGKIIGIFSSIYNHVTGYFGDLLSYARLMALMLAGSVIAQVFNTLGAIPGNIIIFLIISLAGNTLNFALNLLGCYVHDLRLQCLEYFGKFYEDGGKPFRPLAINTKYVDIEKTI